MTGPTASSPAAAPDEDREPPFPPALVEEMLRLFARAVRAAQLYLRNNPTYLKSVDVARASFAPIWAQTDELLLEVTDTQLRWEGRVVANEPDKTTDALPWVLYKDGLRELRLLKGVEDQELVGLIDVITRVRKASTDDDDLLTVLWEKEFSCIRYRYVDLLVDSMEPLEAAPEATDHRLVDPTQVQEPPREEILPAGVVSLDDFNTTLYFLEEREVDYLRTAVQKEYDADLRANVVAILLDTYEHQVDATIRDEICGVLDTLLVNLLTAGQLGTVAVLLRETEVAAERARDITEAQQQRLAQLADRLSEPEALSQLLQSLDERVDAVGQQELNDLFEQLRVRALSTIFEWLGRVQTPRVRAQLETAAARLASANTGELVRLIGAPERGVAMEAMRRAGAMRTAAAVTGLGRMLQQSDAEVRHVAVQALAEIGSPGSMQLLERTIDDASREVRVATLRAFAARAHRPALNRLEGMIRERKVEGADLTEKMAVFEAYGAMCGDAGVALLDGILNGKGLFGKRDHAELRACAAMALGRVGTGNSEKALQKASGDKEILVRNAVNRALRGGAA
ncbi:MAG: HEAT repeat domain-containing protein [Gemmatimonadaceae bacterium]|nr:HEAT repeat domain-containing protein [Gemmatimonadaceae bacterium]